LNGELKKDNNFYKKIKKKKIEIKTMRIKVRNQKNKDQIEKYNIW
jgi:hypothetical protein